MEEEEGEDEDDGCPLFRSFVEDRKRLWRRSRRVQMRLRNDLCLGPKHKSIVEDRKRLWRRRRVR